MRLDIYQGQDTIWVFATSNAPAELSGVRGRMLREDHVGNEVFIAVRFGRQGVWTFRQESRGPARATVGSLPHCGSIEAEEIHRRLGADK